MEDDGEEEEEVNYWDVKRKGRYVTRNPLTTSTEDSRIQSLRTRIGLSSRSRV